MMTLDNLTNCRRVKVDSLNSLFQSKIAFCATSYSRQKVRTPLIFAFLCLSWNAVFLCAAFQNTVCSSSTIVIHRWTKMFAVMMGVKNFSKCNQGLRDKVR